MPAQRTLSVAPGLRLLRIAAGQLLPVLVVWHYLVRSKHRSERAAHGRKRAMDGQDPGARGRMSPERATDGKDTGPRERTLSEPWERRSERQTSKTKERYKARRRREGVVHGQVVDARERYTGKRGNNVRQEERERCTGTRGNGVPASEAERKRRTVKRGSDPLGLMLENRFSSSTSQSRGGSAPPSTGARQ